MKLNGFLQSSESFDKLSAVTLEICFDSAILSNDGMRCNMVLPICYSYLLQHSGTNVAPPIV